MGTILSDIFFEVCVGYLLHQVGEVNLAKLILAAKAHGIAPKQCTCGATLFGRNENNPTAQECSSSGVTQGSKVICILRYARMGNIVTKKTLYLRFSQRCFTI